MCWSFAAAYGLQIARLLEEEKVLSRSDEYRQIRAQNRYRLLPGGF